ncbi:MAG: 6-deoxy-6-sulfogluconolactonase [bacterium]|nr:6-deoxy-6-sulfogluconolactonase [bacterium]
MSRTPELLLNLHCELAENPLWDSERELLYWTDIPKGRVHWCDPKTRAHGILHEGEPVGGFTLEADGALLLFQKDRIARVGLDGQARTLVEDIDPGMTRFNDVIADPEGRVFAGTIAEHPENGGLFRVDPGGPIRSLLRGTCCSNGIAFSPDLEFLYWTCSTRGRIYRFRYNRRAGELSDETVLVEVPPEEGIPDGLTADETGCLWSALWGGHSLRRLSPDGQALDRIDMPVANVTSLTFGGSDLDTLFITTAKGDTKTHPEDGAIYFVRPGARGRTEFRSRIGMIPLQSAPRHGG